jgi:hypothetical protein
MMRAARNVAAMLSVAALSACKAEQNSVTADTAGAGPQATSTAAIGTAGPSGARIAVAHAGPPGEWQMPAGD